VKPQLQLLIYITFFFTTVSSPMSQSYDGSLSAVSSDGFLIALVPYDTSIASNTPKNIFSMIYNAQNGRCIGKIPGIITSFSTDSKMVSSITDTNLISVYKLHTKNVACQFTGIYAKFVGNLLVVAITETAAEIYRITDWKLLRNMTGALTERSKEAFASPLAARNTKILTVFKKDFVTAEDLSIDAEPETFRGSEGSFSDNGQIVAIDSIPASYPTTGIYDVTSRKELSRILGYWALFVPNTHSVMTTKYLDQEHQTTLYDYVTGVPLQTYSGSALQCAPNGKAFIALVDGIYSTVPDSIRVYEFQSGHVQEEFNGESIVFFLPSGKLCVQDGEYVRISP